MDEAARCGRVGFLRGGQLIAEGTPAELRRSLDGRVVELVGRPLARLRGLVDAEPAVENVQMFGDRLHLRVNTGQAQAVIDRLTDSIPASGGEILRLRAIPPQLEDVFFSLSVAEKKESIGD
jgi:ABC-2 type transport system ATP-binding protein